MNRHFYLFVGLVVSFAKGYSSEYVYTCNVQVKGASGFPISTWVAAEIKSDTITAAGMCYTLPYYSYGDTVGIGGTGSLYFSSDSGVDTITQIEEIKFRILGDKSLFPSAKGPDNILYVVLIL